MKKHLILISLLFTTAFPALFGQTLQVGMRWEYLSFPFFIINPNDPLDTVSLEIAGDTLIQGKLYFKLETDVYPCNEYEPITLIREEDSKVYHHFEGNDYLLYDYSLNPGDTLWQTFWNWDNGGYQLSPYPLYIVDTMSVLLGGEWRKVQEVHFNLSSDTLTIYNDIGGLFIEGFGSSYFYFPKSGLCEFAACLRAIYWPNGDSTLVDSLTNCFLIDNTTERAATQTLSVSPNPVQDMLYLHPSQPLSPDAQVRVYDLYGREVYRGAFEAAEKGIATQSWPPGMYVLEVRIGNYRQVLRVLNF
ncbi:MAG: T9SS type A sorting domain-containing protein [Saprospiraceae bacterium]